MFGWSKVAVRQTIDTSLKLWTCQTFLSRINSFHMHNTRTPRLRVRASYSAVRRSQSSESGTRIHPSPMSLIAWLVRYTTKSHCLPEVQLKKGRPSAVTGRS